jgi:cytidylate kinase
VIIAIDGPAGSGKSTTSKLVANRLGISHLDTGSMYRAITAHFIKNSYSLDSIDVSSVMDSIDLEISDSSDRESVFLNGEDVTDRLRSNEVSKLVSDISSVKEVRAKMVRIQRRISSNKSIVIDGRDIGTVVFPDAKFKFFITASIDSRAKRRFDELQESDSNVTLEQIEEEIKSRDHFDTTRDNSPLKKAEDAITIDTTHLSISEQVNMILEIINNNQENTNK